MEAGRVRRPLPGRVGRQAVRRGQETAAQIVLAAVVGGDVLHGGVAHMTDNEDDGDRGAADGAEVVREGEDRPAVGDGAEGSVGRVRELAVVDGLRADDGILARLPGRALGLCKSGPPSALRNDSEILW